MSHVFIPRMIKCPWLPQQIDKKKVLVSATTPNGLELNGEAKIVTSGLNPVGLMSVDIIVTYDSGPVEKTQAVYQLSERQVQRLKPSDNQEYDFIYEGILKPDTQSRKSIYPLRRVSSLS